MRISAKQYATGLYEAVREKKDGEIKAVVKKFIAVLAKNNDFKKAKDVIRNLDKIFRIEEGILEAEIISANPLKKDVMKDLKEYILEMSGAKKLEIKESLDEKILGGVIIKYEDKIVDGSLRSKLFRLKMDLAK
ncbi:MAG: ATP synthase F1 subunit delta [Patescibacteria group bacterium]|jgi:F-type H+-transporting ATPase subunit delta